eukprot:Sdes_comp20993_c0_seq74m19644
MDSQKYNIFHFQAAAWMKATIAEGKTTNNGAFWNGGSSGIFNHANNRDWDEGSICAGKHLFVNGHIGQRNYPTAAMSCVWDTNTKNCVAFASTGNFCILEIVMQFFIIFSYVLMKLLAKMEMEEIIVLKMAKF